MLNVPEISTNKKYRNSTWGEKDTEAKIETKKNSLLFMSFWYRLKLWCSLLMRTSLKFTITIFLFPLLMQCYHIILFFLPSHNQNEAQATLINNKHQQNIGKIKNATMTSEYEQFSGIFFFKYSLINVLIVCVCVQFEWHGTRCRLGFRR